MKRRFLLIIGIILLFLGGFVVLPRTTSWWERREAIAEQESVRLPLASHVISSSSSSSCGSADTLCSGSSSSSIPSVSSYSSVSSSVNWDVPFTSQAPAGNWDPPYDEACEEASVLMALRYFQGKPIISAEDADSGIVALAQANAALGFPIDDTAAQVKVLIESQDPTLNVSLMEDPTIEQMRNSIRSGALIIMPLAGREIGNPYFQTPGPLYHMLVVRGFTDEGFVITNDPGTKRGREFVYRWQTLLDANHDWNGGDVGNGKRVVIVIKK
jgi:hypothetical protein